MIRQVENHVIVLVQEADLTDCMRTCSSEH